jgi:hypothetical protein
VSRPELAALQIADPPHAWAALGFTVVDEMVVVGGVELWLDAAGRGITGWTLRHLTGNDDIDGLATGVATEPVSAGDAAAPRDAGVPPRHAAVHRNGAIGIDQVVVTTPDFDRTAAALDAAGMPLRRIRDAGGFRQGFRRLGPSILELVEVRDGPVGPARFWGLVVIVSDLEALRDQLAPRVSEIRDAVQPGRHIASLSADAGLSPRVAFMDPE